MDMITVLVMEVSVMHMINVAVMLHSLGPVSGQILMV